MRNTSFILALAFTLMSISSQATSLFKPYEAFFYGKTYVNKQTRLTFHMNRSRVEPGFRNCTLINPGVQIRECVWEFVTGENAIIVWVNGNRDWWVINRQGRVIRDANIEMTLETAR